MLRAALVCPPASSFARGLTTARRGPPDVDLALAQHRAYVGALEDLGARVIALDPDPAHPDSTFVEDTAVMVGGGVVFTRPGAASRRGEVDAVRRALRGVAPELGTIEAPGTLDGGDVCAAGAHVLIGLSTRTNESGAAQLEVFLAAAGCTSARVGLPEDGDLLHLKSGIAWLGERRILVADALAAHPALAGFVRVRVDPGEAGGANVVRVGDSVLMPAGCPRLERRLADLGLSPRPLALSEFHKMDGGVSCLSLRIEDAAASLG